MRERVLVVGGDAAGMSAASRIRRVDPSVHVTVLEREGVVSYAACGMPYHLDGRIPQPDALLIRSPAQFEDMGIEVRTGHEVTDLDVAAGRVRVMCRGQGARLRFDYDRLLVATGAHPIRPAMDGAHADNVFVFRRYADLLDLATHLDERHSRRITVVGGGYIGVELAEVLTRRGAAVTIVELADTVLNRTLDPELARLVERELQCHGVQLRLSAPMQALLTDGPLVSRVATSDDEWACDAVVLALGARPSSGLAAAAGITIDGFGAIQTDAELRTSSDGVWSAGDCTSTVSRITGERVWVPLGPAANKQGRIAGSNMAGRHDTFNGVLGTAFVKAFNLQIGRTGLGEQEASQMGLDVVTTMITAGDRAPYYPGGRDTTIKLVADASTGRLLGGQIIGHSGVPGRTNIVAAALHANMDVATFAEIDLGYAPPFAPVWDPLLVAANQFSGVTFSTR